MSPSTAQITRRHFIKSVVATSLLFPLASPLFANRRLFNPRNRFVIPTLNEGIRKGNEVIFNLNIHSGQTSFFRGLSTPTLGINQS